MILHPFYALLYPALLCSNRLLKVKVWENQDQRKAMYNTVCVFQNQNEKERKLHTC